MSHPLWRLVLTGLVLVLPAQAWNLRITLESVATGRFLEVLPDGAIKATGKDSVFWTVLDPNLGLLRFRDRFISSPQPGGSIPLPMAGSIAPPRYGRIATNRRSGNRFS